MTTDERVIAQIAEANPVPDSSSPTVQERAEAERILRRLLEEAADGGQRRHGGPRRRTSGSSYRSRRCSWCWSWPP